SFVAADFASQLDRLVTGRGGCNNDRVEAMSVGEVEALRSEPVGTECGIRAELAGQLQLGRRDVGANDLRARSLQDLYRQLAQKAQANDAHPVSQLDLCL